MILPLPVKFDANEWFTIFFTAISLIIFILLPKRFPNVFTFNILLFVAFQAKLTDYLLAAGIPFDLYDYSDTPKLDLFDEILQTILYPLVGFLYIYLYDVWIIKRYSKILFVVMCTGISTGFEWLALKAHVYTYKGWEIYYSVPTYLILITILIIFFHLMKKWIKIKGTF